jgi:peptidoglycan/LPS O-acetylase OafA/YrhL
MKNKINSGSKFRSDINGLRTWAVIAVILYHFGVPGFGGGFVGVDVFFVISGFLMTGIVVLGLESEDAKFSIINFYFARARRILPALIVLCVVLLLLGWFVLLPIDYEKLGIHAVFSLTFLSNIKFWGEAGYFDTASHEKWLLHTWSLAVEWQFYLLLPLILLAIWKWKPGRRSVILAMAAGLLVSLALSIMFTPLRATSAFFLLPTRTWEMLAGGLVYLLAHRFPLTTRQRTIFEAVGLLLIIGSVAGFTATSPWPGWRALVPVLGAVAILLAARSDSYWTGQHTAQWLGTRSYSLYLWHWPIVVALTYVEWQNNSLAVAGGLVLTLALGDLSYRLVESPVRIGLSRMLPFWGAAALFGTMIIVAVAGLEISSKQGIANRFSAEVEKVANESTNINPRTVECYTTHGTRSPSCIYGGDRLRAILIGDSHANAVTTSIAAAVPDRQDGIMAWTYVGCPTLIGVKNMSPKYHADEKCGIFWIG